MSKWDEHNPYEPRLPGEIRRRQYKAYRSWWDDPQLWVVIIFLVLLAVLFIFGEWWGESSVEAPIE